MSQKLFDQRRLRVTYVNADPKSLGMDLVVLEQKLKLLGDIELTTIKSLNDQTDLSACDLLIVAALYMDGDYFKDWFLPWARRQGKGARIWTPALICSAVPFKVLAGMLGEAVAMNWYFDIVHPDHIDSLPIRVANLLRIHDHLHEINRYEEILRKLTLQTESLEKQLRDIKNQ